MKTKTTGKATTTQRRLSEKQQRLILDKIETLCRVLEMHEDSEESISDLCDQLSKPIISAQVDRVYLKCKIMNLTRKL